MSVQSILKIMCEVDVRWLNDTTINSMSTNFEFYLKLLLSVSSLTLQLPPIAFGSLFNDKCTVNLKIKAKRLSLALINSHGPLKVKGELEEQTFIIKVSYWYGMNSIQENHITASLTAIRV